MIAFAGKVVILIKCYIEFAYYFCFINVIVKERERERNRR